MQVVKRNGTRELVKLEKITKRIERHSKDLKNVSIINIAQKVVQGLYDGVSSVELDNLATETAYSMCVKHPEYDKLATRLAISALHKETLSTFSATMEKLYDIKDETGQRKNLVDEKVIKFIRKNSSILDSAIDYNRDYLFDYFGYKTLEKSYLTKIAGKIIERPQHMWMRVSCGIHYDDIDAALSTYQILSSLKATHATPTLFNSGMTKNQLSSCFLIAMKDDSINGIYETLKETALISQSAGGIGLHIHNIRSKGSPIYGTGGVSNGIVPMLRNFNECARYVDQCFTETTLINTENGLKQISFIDTNDKVLTSDGTFKNVLKNKKFDKRERQLIKIKTSNGEISVTPNHLLLVIKNGANEQNIDKKIKNGVMSPTWITAHELTKHDILINI